MGELGSEPPEADEDEEDEEESAAHDRAIRSPKIHVVQRLGLFRIFGGLVVQLARFVGNV